VEWHASGVFLESIQRVQHRRPPKLSDALYLGGHRIFLTMCTHGRRAYFEPAEIVDVALSELLRTATANEIEIIAYCFMPDHLHALIAGASEYSDAKRFTAVFRHRSGFRYRQRKGERLWQEGYFDRHLRKEDRTVDVVSYIVANPVRSGLCRTVCEYPYSGSSRYELADLVNAVQWKPTPALG
jgi:REP-associated tyrosine transposase